MIDPGPEKTALAKAPASRTHALKASAAILILGSLCPWMSALGLVSVNGLQIKLGWVTLCSGVAILALTSGVGRRHSMGLSGRQRRRVVALLGSISVVACVFVILGISGASYALVQPEWGLYLTLVAAAAAIWSARGGDPAP